MSEQSSNLFKHGIATPNSGVPCMPAPDGALHVRGVELFFGF